MDLITQIKKALETAGLDVALAEKIKVTDAGQIDAEIEKLKGKIDLTPEQFIEACKEAGLGSSLDRYVQKISDQRVSGALKTYQGNLEKKDLSDKERIESLEGEVKEFKSNKSKEDLDSQIKTELKKQNLSDGLLRYIRIDDPNKVEEAVKALKEDILGVQQKVIDEKLKDGDIPSKGETTTGGDVVTEKYVENKNAGKIAGNPFEGKLDEGKSESKGESE